jgi:hypothetical protein
LTSAKVPKVLPADGHTKSESLDVTNHFHGRYFEVVGGYTDRFALSSELPFVSFRTSGLGFDFVVLNIVVDEPVEVDVDLRLVREVVVEKLIGEDMMVDRLLVEMNDGVELLDAVVVVVVVDTALLVVLVDVVLALEIRRGEHIGFLELSK